MRNTSTIRSSSNNRYTTEAREVSGRPQQVHQGATIRRKEAALVSSSAAVKPHPHDQVHSCRASLPLMWGLRGRGGGQGDSKGGIVVGREKVDVGVLWQGAGEEQKVLVART